MNVAKFSCLTCSTKPDCKIFMILKALGFDEFKGEFLYDPNDFKKGIFEIKSVPGLPEAKKVPGLPKVKLISDFPEEISELDLPEANPVVQTIVNFIYKNFFSTTG